MLKFISYVMIFVLGFAACATVLNRRAPHFNILGGGSVASIPAPAPTSGEEGTGAGPGTTIYAVAKVEPSVVNIDITEKAVAAPRDAGPFSMPFPFGGSQDESPQSEARKGQASGVIISSDGYILTNNHVAGDASSLSVTMHDGHRFKARVIGLDPKSDLAVIKVDATNLPAATPGNSADVKVGQWVIAVGNPLGIGSTATRGIISAIRSPFVIKDHIFPEIIQTDASINPGNSGGALADLDGNIIGINTAIASTSGGSIGIGFSIPINMAIQHANELIKSKSVTYPWLGVGYKPQQNDQAPDAKGVVITKVMPDSPAAKAGLQAGDIILQINKRDIDEYGKVNFLVMQHKPGDTVPVLIARQGQTRSVDVTLGKLPHELENPQVQQQQVQPQPDQMQPQPQDEGSPLQR